MVFFTGSAVLAGLSAYCWLGIKRAYDKGVTLPFRVSIAIWILDTLHLVLVSLASLYGIWQLQFNSTVALAIGLVLIGIGLTTLLTGMITFRSLRRVSGMDSSELVARGIYRWSRNPQYIGWFICLFGISLIGRSGLAFLLSVVLIIGIHLYNVKLEEPYLERVFGDQYRLYKSKTARYVGIPKKRDNTNSSIG